MVRKIPIHSSLYRPILFVGCERLPFISVITIGGIMIMAYQTLFMLIIVLIFYLTALALIRRINEEDPQFFKCIYRYLRYYVDYYPANEFYPGKDYPVKSYFK